MFEDAQINDMMRELAPFHLYTDGNLISGKTFVMFVPNFKSR